MASEFRLSVCPHDTAKNLLGWYTLNTYLQRKLDVGIAFKPEDNFLVERQNVLERDYHIVYANPASALCFSHDRGFVAVARPVGAVDEAVLVAAKEGTVPDAPRIASATDKLIIHSLGLYAMKTIGIDPGQATFTFVGNHLSAAKAVLRGEADIGFIFNETWNGMSDITRSGLRILAASTDGKAFHCFMVAPSWMDRRQDIQDLLCRMHLDPRGKRVLDDLQFPAFEPVSEGALGQLAELVNV